jgi:TonB family protein
MNSTNIKARLLWGILCAAAVCCAQDVPGVSPPHLRSKVQAQYSEEARKARLEGTVLLRIVVGSDGGARDFEVLRSVGMGLDENAIAAVRKWQFEPGTKDGQPVNVRVQIEVNFRLGDHPNVRWHLVRAEFHLPPGASRPIIEKGPAPRVANEASNASATATFDVNEKGEAVDARIDKASDDEWGHDVSDALGKWRFTPASKDGKPVSVSCTMDFVRGELTR